MRYVGALSCPATIGYLVLGITLLLWPDHCLAALHLRWYRRDDRADEFTPKQRFAARICGLVLVIFAILWCIVRIAMVQRELGPGSMPPHLAN